MLRPGPVREVPAPPPARGAEGRPVRMPRDRSPFRKHDDKRRWTKVVDIQVVGDSGNSDSFWVCCRWKLPGTNVVVVGVAKMSATGYETMARYEGAGSPVLVSFRQGRNGPRIICEHDSTGQARRFVQLGRTPTEPSAFYVDGEEETGIKVEDKGRATPLPEARPCGFPIWRLRGATWRMSFVPGEPQDRFGSSPRDFTSERSDVKSRSFQNPWRERGRIVQRTEGAAIRGGGWNLW